MDDGGRSRSTSRSPHRAVVVCTPGLEQWCRQELVALGIKPKAAGPGTFEADVTTRQIYAANVWLRTASRVLVRVAQFRATDFARLQAKVADVDWPAVLPAGMAPHFRISANESKLYHTDAVAQRLHQVVGPPSLGQPEQLFVVRIERNTVSISADTSGQALHHRPWRTDLSPAPLRTTMAAAALLAVGWDGTVPLIDPFCGAGTIPIEAALLARDLPPGTIIDGPGAGAGAGVGTGIRDFAFRHWPGFEAGTWASVTGQAAARARDRAADRAGQDAPVIIAGSDRDEAMVAAARANAERAGVEVAWEKRVVSHLPARSGPGLVLTNPPFGKRVGDGALDGLYGRFGAVVAQRLTGWDLAVISPDRKLAHQADRRLAPVARFRHGGLQVELLHRPAATDAAG